MTYRMRHWRLPGGNCVRGQRVPLRLHFARDMTPARGKKRSDIPRCLLCSKASFLYVGVADNGGPARDFDLDESAELIWSHVFRGEALLAQQVDRIGCMHCLFRRRGKLI